MKLLENVRRVKELEDILCPCEQHDYVIADESTEFPYIGGPSCEVYSTRKLICKKCKKVTYDHNGMGSHYKHKVMS